MMKEAAKPVLVLFEPKWEMGGHHPSWFKELVGQLLCLDQYVVALCPEPGELEEAVSSWVPVEKFKRLTTYAIPDQRELLGKLGKTPLRMFRGLAMAREYNRHLIRATANLNPGPDCVWFGLTDLFALRVRGFGKWASRMFSLPYAGLFFFPRPPPKSSIYRLLFDDLGFFRSERCMGIAVLSERDRLLLQRQYAKPVWCLPDFRAGGHDAASLPIDSSITFEINNLACGRKIILMAGDISPRKGLVRFLELAASCQAENYFFVVAGALHEDAFTASDQQKIARAKSFSNLFIHPDRIASDREFDAVISQADILYAVYPDFDHSSNMLIHAAVNEIPIIVASGMEMGLRVEEYQLGATVDPGNIDEMKRALVRFSENDSSNAARFIAGCKAYRDFHTAKEFARGVLRICTTSSNNRR